MAERRMFAKTIIDSDAFLDMPVSSRLLYYDLSMRADDDGFVNGPKKIIRTIGASEDDMKLLITKKFVIPFENGIVVIKHWRIHNYIQKDRYTETKYKEEKAALQVDENGAYTTNKAVAQISINTKKPLTAARVKRLDVKKQSDLPYSFEYKIRNAFVGEPCPVCGIIMGHTEFSDRLYFPTIQHNIPISKGGTHDLENISVICRSCNSTIQDKETPPYNTEKVKEIWRRIGNVSGMDTQVRLGKDRLGKDSIYGDKIEYERLLLDKCPDKRSDKPTPEKEIELDTEKEIKITKKEIELFFESIWELYPSKKGKASISDSKKKVLYSIGFDTIKNCIDRYVKDKEEWRPYKDGSTFFNSGYVDYLDENYVQAEPQKPKEKDGGIRW